MSSPKRALDVLLSLVGLVTLSPLMLIVAAGVRLTSRGPVLFSQTRVGLNGRAFTLLKFRTMRVGAEDATGPVWALPDDARCTPIGRVLRRLNIDELPQVLNVLAGHMSLVGPRPERPEFVERFQREIPGYARRHSVPPGITGWAQVHGWTGPTSLDERIRHDLHYIDRASFGLDLRILFMTFFVGFRKPAPLETRPIFPARRGRSGGAAARSAGGNRETPSREPRRVLRRDGPPALADAQSPLQCP